MKRSTDGHRELADLLARVADGTVTAADSQRLNVLMSDDVEARALYIDYVVTDAMLRWTDNAGAPSEPMAMPDTPTRGLGAWRVAAAIVFALAIVGLIAGAMMSGGATDNPAPLGPVVAVLAEASGTLLVEDTGAPAEAGNELRSGWLSLSQGTAEIVFDRGATVRLAGPARMRLDSANRAELSDGWLVAEVPPSAVGFTVTSGAWQVVDLGTSFGMKVGPAGDASVHVFRGRVRLDGRGDSRVIDAGEAMFASGDGLAEIPLDRPSFAGLRLSIADAADPEEVPAEQSLALWLRADRGIDRDETGRVGAWRDVRSELPGRAVQENSIYRPLWVTDGIHARPALRFDGGNYLQLPPTGAMGIGGDYEVFIVARTDDSRIQFLLAGSEQGGVEWYELHLNPESGLRFIPAPSEATPGAPVQAAYADIGKAAEYVGEAQVVHARVTGDTAFVGVNGIESSDTVAMPTVARWAGELTIGMRGNAGYGLRGEIAELLIYDTKLDDTDRGSVIDYLIERYGIEKAPDQLPEGVNQ